MIARLAIAGSLLLMTALPSMAAPGAPLDEARRAVAGELVKRHGAAETARIERGLAQVARQWQPADGTPEDFRGFALEQFVPAGPALDALFARLEFALERQDGYLVSLQRDLRRGIDLDLGPQLPVDALLAQYDVFAHVQDDWYTNRLAFTVLLNFPETTLAERLAEGPRWTRRQWAEARLAARFDLRLPAAVRQRMAQATAAADGYVNGYNIWMHHVLTADGKRPFPAGMRLISHWNLRDQVKAEYAEKDGLVRQRLIADVMAKIIRQEIPRAVIDNPRLDWTPATGTVRPSPVPDGETAAGATAAADPAREPDERYRTLLNVFHAFREADRYDAARPTAILRAFDRNREIPEAEVRRLLESVLDAPVGKEVAALVAKRLGRPLEPFDIWYAGFRPRARWSEADLDRKTRERYPTAEAFARDLPRILRTLGFSEQQATFLASNIVVDPSRGAGHAMGAGRRDDAAHLRTRVGKAGMDYKGYNIAVHELGHNCEQVFSTTAIDHTLLGGVPNTAFTEAMAFLFQERDMELLGLGTPDAAAERLLTIDAFWSVREIAGVALVDMDTWHWLYEHPDATPAQLREAVVAIANKVWNRWYAPLFGKTDVPLLAIYSHSLTYPLYLPDYPMGHLIAFQVGEHFKTLSGTTFGAEFERMTKLGALTPDAWMRAAVGAPLSAEPLLKATAEAIRQP